MHVLGCMLSMHTSKSNSMLGTLLSVISVQTPVQEPFLMEKTLTEMNIQFPLAIQPGQFFGLKIRKKNKKLDNQQDLNLGSLDPFFWPYHLSQNFNKKLRRPQQQIRTNFFLSLSLTPSLSLSLFFTLCLSISGTHIYTLSLPSHKFLGENSSIKNSLGIFLPEILLFFVNEVVWSFSLQFLKRQRNSIGSPPSITRVTGVKLS